MNAVFDKANPITLSGILRLKAVKEYLSLRGNLPTFSGVAKIKALKQARELLAKLGYENAPNIQPAETPQNPENPVSGSLNAAELYRFDENKTKAQRQRDNNAVFDLLDKVERGELQPENLTATDKATLAKYSGSGGGLKSRDGKTGSAHEYYTPAPVAQAMWQAISEMGFSGGKVLDPCSGSGIFGAFAPENAIVQAVEMDETSATVNKLVNGGERYHVDIASFEERANDIPDNSVDAIVTNVPFGDVSLRKHRNKDSKFQKENLQTYFVLRSLDKLRHGGLAAFIVPSSFLDDKGGKAVNARVLTSQIAEFIGAYRLPNSVFGTAAADVATDVIFYRKYSADVIEKIAELQAQNPDILNQANVMWDVYTGGQYFRLPENKKFIFGEEGEVESWRTDKDGNKQKVYAVINNDSVANIAQAIKKFSGSRIDWALLEATETEPQTYNQGDTVYQNGQAYVFDGVKFNAVEVSHNEAESHANDIMAKLDTPLSAFEHKLTAKDIQAACEHYAQTSQHQHIPSWAAQLSRDLNAVAQSKREQQCRRVLVGLSVQYVMDNFAGNDQTENHADLSEAMKLRVSLDKALSRYKKANEAIKLHYDRKTGFSAAWKGESATIEQDLSIEKQIEQSQYLNGTLALPIETVRELGIDPIASDDWCVNADGTEVMKADDYFVGNLQDCLDKIEADFQAATSDEIRAKLAKMREIATQRVKPIDVKNMRFGLRSPFVDNQILLRFIEQKLKNEHSNMKAEMTQTEKGKLFVDIVGNTKTDNDRILARIGDYLRNGRISHGSIKIYHADGTQLSKRETLEVIREEITKWNAEFDTWLKADKAFMDGIDDKANDPKNLQFPQVDDESPVAISGSNADVKLHGYQNAFVRKTAREFAPINSFGVGLGKAQPLNAKVLTPSGWRKMGDLKVGDMVVAYDGTFTPITGIYPQGEKDIFEVVFSDGSKTECCDEHLWQTQTENDRKNECYARKIGQPKSIVGTVKPLSEIRTTLLYGKKQKNHKIPMIGKIDLPERNLPINPYLLGVLLGDGSFTHKSVTFTTPEIEIAEKIKFILSQDFSGSLYLHKRTTQDRCQSYGISKTETEQNNVLTEKMREFGLQGATSESKFIPEIYLTASFNQRLALLHGLMDTDGYVSKNGITVQYYSTSEKLAVAVVELVQSLGGIAWRKVKSTHYKKDDVKVDCKDCWIVSIRMPSEVNPFSLTRKAERVTPKTKYIPVRYIVEVNAVGKKQAKCISIEHESHLYITDEYIVTHNTFTGMAAAQYALETGTKKKVCFIVPNAVLSNWDKESKRYFTESERERCLFVGAGTDKNGDFVVESKNYARDLNRILENKHNKIFMTQQAFEKIRIQEESAEKYSDYIQSVDKSFSASKNAKKDEIAEAKRENLIANILGKNKLENAPFFEDLGIDAIVIDEAHHFKNAKQATENAQVRGLPSGDPSNRAVDMAVKAWLIRGGNPRNDGVMALTATPVTNSPLEIYAMLSLAVGEERINQAFLGQIKGADDFIEAICEIQSREEQNLAGEMVSVQSLVGIKNLDLVQNLIQSVADVKEAADVGMAFKQVESEDFSDGIQLDKTTKRHLDKFKNAYRIARKAMKTDDLSMATAGENEQAISDYFAVLKDVGTPEKVGHPFSMVNRMSKALLDVELLDETTKYTVNGKDHISAEKAIEAFNSGVLPSGKKGKIPVFQTFRQPENRDLIVKQENKTDEDGNKTTLYTVQAQAVLKDGVIVLNNNDFNAQLRLENLLDKEQADISVSISPKIAALVENVKKEQVHIRYTTPDGEKAKFAKQIIFVESLAMHTKIKRILAKECGIPSSRITFISGQFNSDPDEIIEVQEKFNGDDEDGYSIVIANKKAEVGINLQKGCQAIHHLELNWTPDSITQRNGRGIRQGNTAEKVNVYFYEADGTFDTYKRTAINRKSNWIESVMSKQQAENGFAEVGQGLTEQDYSEMIEFDGSAAQFEAMLQRQEQRKQDEIRRQAIAAQEVNIGIIRTANQWFSRNETAFRALLVEAQAANKDNIALIEAKKRLNQSIEKGLAEKTIAKNQKEYDTAYAKMEKWFERFGGLSFKYNGNEIQIIRKVTDEDRNAYDGYLYRGKDFYVSTHFNEDGLLGFDENHIIAQDWKREHDKQTALRQAAYHNAMQSTHLDGAMPDFALEMLYNGELLNVIDGQYLRKNSIVLDTKGNWYTFTPKVSGFDKNGGKVSSCNLGNHQNYQKIWQPTDTDYMDGLKGLADWQAKFVRGEFYYKFNGAEYQLPSTHIPDVLDYLPNDVKPIFNLN